MPGQLFTSYFLEEGILHTAAFHTINEASTEQELIRPMFELLGWAHYLLQQGSDHNEDILDHLLFGDAESKSRAAAKPAPAERGHTRSSRPALYPFAPNLPKNDKMSHLPAIRRRLRRESPPRSAPGAGQYNRPHQGCFKRLFRRKGTLPHPLPYRLTYPLNFLTEAKLAAGNE